MLENITIVLAAGTAVFLGLGLIGWIADHFNHANKVVDAPKDRDTEFDRRWAPKTYNRQEVYDQEKDR